MVADGKGTHSDQEAGGSTEESSGTTTLHGGTSTIDCSNVAVPVVLRLPLTLKVVNKVSVRV